jgi:hypothetical protein
MALALTSALLPALPAAATPIGAPVDAPVVVLDETFDVPEPVLSVERMTNSASPQRSTGAR